MDKFKNKYRIPSARASWWDYGWTGAYFITICTQNREHYFGEIVRSQWVASPLGKIAESCWHEIPNQFPFIELGAFVVMPNHVHGIIIIHQSDTPNENVGNNGNENGNGGNVETQLIASLQNQNQNQERDNWDGHGGGDKNSNSIGGITGNKNPMLHNNLSRVIRWYKGRCTFEMRKLHAEFAWQSRFHDHIIRNAEEFERIHHYIQNNPINWQNDELHKYNNK